MLCRYIHNSTARWISNETFLLNFSQLFTWNVITYPDFTLSQSPHRPLLAELRSIFQMHDLYHCSSADEFSQRQHVNRYWRTLSPPRKQANRKDSKFRFYFQRPELLFFCVTKAWFSYAADLPGTWPPALPGTTLRHMWTFIPDT